MVFESGNGVFAQCSLIGLVADWAAAHGQIQEQIPGRVQGIR